MFKVTFSFEDGSVVEAFANTGGMPNASRAGYETSDDAPTA